MAASKGTGARKGDKDRSYRHVFKGSVLVNTLLDYDVTRFSNRQAAVKFAQRLLDLGQVESIVGKRAFEDGVALYRWVDETVVREAKKIAHTTTTTHIPKRRLIELLDLQHADGPSEGYSVERTRENFSTPTTRPATRKTSTTTTPATTRPSRAASTGPQQRRARSNVNNNNSAVARPSRDSSAAAKTRDGSTTAKPRDSSAVRPARAKSVAKTTAKTSTNNASAPASHQRGTSGSSMRASDPDVRIRTENAESRRTATQEAGNSAQRGAVELVRCPDSSIRPLQRSGANSRADDKVLSTVDTSIERHVDKVLDGKTGASLAVPDDYDSFDNDVFTSPATTPTTSQRSLTSQEAPPQTDDARASAGARFVTSHDADAYGATSSSGDDTSLTAVTGDLANLTAENSGFSDNEKQLLKQMRKIQEEHKAVIKEYEREIKELMATISELQRTVEQQQQEKKEATSAVPAPPAASGTPTPEDTCTAAKDIPAAPALVPDAPPPPGAPPAPPPPPVAGPNTFLKTTKTVAPTKPQILPRVKMRPLFWNRILLGQFCDDEDDEPTFWHSAEEPNFDVVEFESLFGKDPAKDLTKKKSLHELITTKKDASTKQQNVKLLDENRSRAVGIKLRSMHCDMKDIRNAVYKMQFTKLDIESIHGLYEIKGNDEEIAKVVTYLEEHPGASLDQPEQFLLELSKMPQFSERIECLIFRKSFNETLFNIDQQLDTVQQACHTLKRSQPIHALLELILAFGNYMNGGTQRGQADAFDLEVISKLKDVKSIDNSTNLLRHIVRIQSLEECDAGKNEAVYKLPDSSAFTQAATVTFKEVTAELNRLKGQLKAHSRKADIVCLNADVRDLQPFKDQMEDFFESAETMLKGQIEKMESTRDTFQILLKFFTVKDPQTSPETFFGLWNQFLDDYKSHWKVEQKNIAKNMFNSVQDRRKERMRRRRESVKEEGKSSMLKEKFSSRRRRSMAGDSQSLSSNLFRSQSVCAVDSAGRDDCDVTSCATEPRARSRRRLEHTQSVDVTLSMMSLDQDNSQDQHSGSFSVEKSANQRRERSNLMRSRSTAGVLRTDESSETMSERMKHRRRNILSDDYSDTPPTTPDATPARTPSSRRTPADSRVSQSQLSQRVGARLASESSASPSANESLKERMDRRRRERHGTVSDSHVATPGMSGRLSNAKSSIDLATIRQKFSGQDSPASATSPLPVERRAAIDRRASSSNLDVQSPFCSVSGKDQSCDHPSCQVNRTVSCKDRTVSTSDLNRSQRRDAWRGSQTTLADDPSSRTRGRESWRGSQGNLSEIGAVKTAISNLKPAKERESISWRTSKASSVPEPENSANQSTPTARQKQQSRPKTNLTRDPLSWRGSQTNLSESVSKQKDSWRGSHQNLSNLSDDSLRARKKEAWRNSQGNLAASGNSSVDDSLSRSRRKEAWRSSQTNLADNAEVSSPRMRRSSSRTSINEVGTEPGRLRKTSSTSLNDANPDQRRSRRESTAKSTSQSGIQSGSESSPAKSACASSGVVATDSKLTAKEEDALSERDYRERLRKLSRSRQNLVDAKR